MLPLLLAMLCGFGWLGVTTGIRAVSRAPARVVALASLLGVAGALGAAVMLIAFGIVAHRTVPAGAFASILALAVSGGLGLAGMLLQQRFDKLGRPVDGVPAAACFLAGAAFPIAWLTFAERLAGWFDVTWIY